MAHFIYAGNPTNLVQVQAGADDQVDLWGDGPGGVRLDVVSSDASVFRVDEFPASFANNIRRFTIHGIRQGSARLFARVGPGGPIWADTRVMVGYDTLYRYYHGTSSSVADVLLGVDLTPMTIPPPSVMAFDWTDYTDFGKGFYVHLDGNKGMAWEWARRRFPGDYGVVEFIATPDELSDLWRTALHFSDKADRPGNSPRPGTVVTTIRSRTICPVPQLLPCVRVTRERTTVAVRSSTMSWLEFVEFNRHIDPSGALIARPNDRDWTGTYSRIRGPIWVPRDSGYDTGLQPFPDHIHQLNWGQAGMAVLNRGEVKVRRFKFSTANEGLFPPPA